MSMQVESKPLVARSAESREDLTDSFEVKACSYSLAGYVNLFHNGKRVGSIAADVLEAVCANHATIKTALGAVSGDIEQAKMDEQALRDAFCTAIKHPIDVRFTDAQQKAYAEFKQSQKAHGKVGRVKRIAVDAATTAKIKAQMASNQTKLQEIMQRLLS